MFLLHLYNRWETGKHEPRLKKVLIEKAIDFADEKNSYGGKKYECRCLYHKRKWNRLSSR